MSREIKFRAWFVDGESAVMDGQVCSMQEDRPLHEFLSDIQHAANDHGYKYILMQFTGLHDKNGVEIYEGDIVEWSNDSVNWQIYWHEAEGAWMAKEPHTYGGLGMPELTENECEVIGNICENSYLLK